MSYNNHPSGGYKGGSPRPPKLTFQEMAIEVKNTYFKGSQYQELLTMKDSKQLDLIFESLETLAKETSKGLTTSQLRNVYAKIVQASDVLDLKMIRPNLAYVAARIEKQEGKKMMSFIDDLVKNVQTEEQRKSFNKVMESIVAYHKFATK